VDNVKMTVTANN